MFGAPSVFSICKLMILAGFGDNFPQIKCEEERKKQFCFFVSNWFNFFFCSFLSEKKKAETVKNMQIDIRTPFQKTFF